VLRIALAEHPITGLWEAFEVCLIVARQNGKGSILEALELGWLFLLNAQVAHTAQLASTSREAYGRLLGHIRRTPWLDVLVPDRLVRRSADDFSISTLRGGRIEFGPRSSRTGRGTGKDFVVYDEAMFLGSAEISAQVPTMSTRDNPQLWYTSSAGMVGSEHLRGLRDRGRAGARFDAGHPEGIEAEGMAYFEWSPEVPSDLDLSGIDDPERLKAYLDDIDNVAAANPGLGLRISLHYVRGERRVMSKIPREWARERLSLFDEPSVTGRVITADQWKAVQNTGAIAAGAAVFAVTVNDARTSATITAAAWTAEGTPVVEVVAIAAPPALAAAGPYMVDVDEPEVADDVDDPEAAYAELAEVAGDELPPPPPGLQWVLQWFAERPGARVVVWQQSPAGGLVGRLVAGGADVVKASTQQLARASMGFFDAVVSGQVAQLGDEVLATAVAAGRKRDLAEGAWHWSPRASDGDIGALVGGSLALDTLTSGAAERVYPGYRAAEHSALPPEDLDDEPGVTDVGWRRLWTYALGVRRPLVWQCWVVDPDERLYLQHELYRLDVSAEEAAAQVLALGLPSPHTVLSDTPRDERRAFEVALGTSARPPLGGLAEGIQAVRARLADGRLYVAAETVVSIDNRLRKAARPTCTADEFAGYTWPADGKEKPCGDPFGLDGLRWAVSYVDLRPKAAMRMVGG
jgi:hypothetical protein